MITAYGFHGLDPVSFTLHATARPGALGLLHLDAALPKHLIRELAVTARCAIAESGAPLSQAVTVTVPPSVVTRTGAGLTLAVALAALVADGTVPGSALQGLVVHAEIGLGGRLNGTRHVFNVVRAAADAGARGVIVSPENADGALFAADGRIAVYAVDTLRELIEALCKNALVAAIPGPARPCSVHALASDSAAHVRFAAGVWRALEIAAAGGHSVLLIGPPGTGKSLFARSVCALRSAPHVSEAREIASVLSAAGFPVSANTARPFRAPHHTVSEGAMLGILRNGEARPGEVSLAQHGILFLDELAEFRRPVLDAVFDAHAHDFVRIHEGTGESCVVGADFQLIASVNDDEASLKRIEPYRSRFDLVIKVPRAQINAPALGADAVNDARKRIASAALRAAKHPFKVSRTIAALDGAEEPTTDHRTEAALLSGRGE